jgi:hypothetical protein
MDINLAYRRQLLPAPGCDAQPSAQQRARICAVIAFELALEDLNRTNSRREVWARLAIGLPAFSRTIGEQCR